MQPTMNRPIFFQEADRPARPKRASHRWLTTLGVLFVAALFGFVMAEFLTRMIWGRSIVLFPKYQEDVKYGEYLLRRLEPSTKFQHKSADGSWLFTTNAQGFRDTHDYTYEKAAGVRRILCLGDSQTLGFEAAQEKIFPAIIEKRLTRLGRKVEILNTAIAGYGTAEQVAFFENEGLKYQPDVVVLGWFIDDFDENEASRLFRLADGNLLPDKHEYVPGIATMKFVNNILPLRWASERSYLYSGLFAKAWDARKAILSQQQQEGGDGTPRISYQGATISRHQMELAAALVRRLHVTCAKRGIKLLVIDIPWLPLNNTGFGSSMPEAFASQVAEASDAVLGAGEVLGQYRGVTDIFVPQGENHLSESSHLLTGMAAAAKIAEWLPESAP
jgi:hypothetical protein